MKGLNEQFKIMSSLQDYVEKDEVMETEVAELLFAKPMNNLYQSLASVLKDNNVIAAE